VEISSDTERKRKSDTNDLEKKNEQSKKQKKQLNKKSPEKRIEINESDDETILSGKKQKNQQTKKKSTCNICNLEKAEATPYDAPLDFYTSFIKCRCPTPLYIHPICLPVRMILNEEGKLDKENLDLIYCKNCAQETTSSNLILPAYLNSTKEKKQTKVNATIAKQNQFDIIKKLQNIENSISGVHGEVTKTKIAQSSTKPIFTVAEFEKKI